ncbi:metallophosphoesterase [Olivibacter sitiensis]|uniref:metallophosphoesterase n=1 Tax=Olivibacter sitiensis TaxID=376470 RepID=UPI000415DDB5|nr:metallophosphoesterase [Olivibacter sitiensis]
MIIKLLAIIAHPIRKVLNFFLRKPIVYFANKVSSAPIKEDVFESLSYLYEQCTRADSDSLFEWDMDKSNPIIILSDQHKGNKGGSDEFAAAEDNYVAALNYYNKQKAYYINLGDSEDFWKYNIFSIMSQNKRSFAAEAKFHRRKAMAKIYGNHDVFWHLDPLAPIYLKEIYGRSVRMLGAMVIRLNFPTGNHFDIFCTHGHQGDKQSDGNKFSVWFVTYIWAPLQSFLRININTPAHDNRLKSVHNQLMYEWSARQNNLLLITGHTHQPVFNSLSHLERLYLRLDKARREKNTDEEARILKEIPRRLREYDVLQMDYGHLKPSYFNTGCCCFDDGTITGIELAEGCIRLVKWHRNEASGQPERIVAEEESLEALINDINKHK